MRPVSLTSISGGINRQRIKGNAAPNSLYDLVNAFVTQAGTILPREGTIRDATLDANTVGLVAFEGALNVFSNAVQSVPDGYVDNVLVDPANTANDLVTIWYAQPFMGFLYVVAEFVGGDVIHYWLQSSGEWAPNTVYQAGQIVTPDTPNGLAYQATRTSLSNPTWAPNTATTMGAKVEPSTPNGFYFVATYVAGTNPTTGTTEPTWPTTIGGVVDDFGNFQVNQLATTSTPTAPLSSSITNIYGDTTITPGGATVGSGPTIGGVTYTTASSTSTATGGTVTPQGQVSTWVGGTLYLPGALVIPSTNQGAVTGAIPNGDFEDGDDGAWTKSGNWAIGAVGVPFQGSDQAYNSPAVVANGKLTQAVHIAVVPGKTITATCMGNNGTNSAADFDVVLELVWYNASDLEISATQSAQLGATGNHWKQMTVTGTAPAGAAFVAVRLLANSGTSSRDTCGIDVVSWDYVAASTATGLIYQNVATSAGISGATEPTWPSSPGGEVTDGGAIWEAVGASVITWTAYPIQYSGGSEPTFPTTVGATVFDGQSSSDPGAFAWTAIARNVPGAPKNARSVVTAATKVFAINGDTVGFSATTNPTDWESQNNAGFLPTGLQQYGSNPAAVLGLYRGNLLVFNSGGYQMWQVDPDPANMAILDAQPIGSTFTRAYQSVANDGLFLTIVGVRNVGTTGSSANMQTGTTGQPIDVLIQAELDANTYVPISLYYPARGQYWLIFGPTAYVLTVNGNNQRSWSRYVFPDAITDWTLGDEILFLRSAGNLVWEVSRTTLQDDEYYTPGSLICTMVAGANTGYSGYGDGTTEGPVYGSLAPTTVGTAGTIATMGSQWNSFTHNYFELSVTGASSAPLQTDVTSVAYTGLNGARTLLTSGVTIYSTSGNTASWIWHLSNGLESDEFSNGVTYTITIDAPSVTPVLNAIPFTGVIWWPWLDMGELGLTKEVIGFDLVGTGEVNVAIGYDQSDLSAFTPNFLLESADTIYGQPTPLPVSGPSFSLYLEFSANQAWQWEAANLYVNDRRSTG